MTQDVNNGQLDRKRGCKTHFTERTEKPSWLVSYQNRSFLSLRLRENDDRAHWCEKSRRVSNTSGWKLMSGPSTESWGGFTVRHVCVVGLIQRENVTNYSGCCLLYKCLCGLWSISAVVMVDWCLFLMYKQSMSPNIYEAEPPASLTWSDLTPKRIIMLAVL